MVLRRLDGVAGWRSMGAVNRSGAPELSADLLRRAAALVPRLKDRAARAEQLRRTPPETLQDLVE